MTETILFLVGVTFAAIMAVVIGRAIFVADNIMNQQDERANLLHKQLDFMTDKAVKLEQALMKRDKEIERLVHTIQERLVHTIQAIQEMQDEINRTHEPHAKSNATCNLL